MQKIAPQFTAKKEELNGRMVSAIRDFQAWLRPLNRTLWNGWSNRGGVGAPHAFTFKLGYDLSFKE